MTTETRRYWSVRRIAERWSCSKGKIYKLLRSTDGEPPRLASVTLDGMVRIRDEDLAAYESRNIACRTVSGSDVTAGAGLPSRAMGQASVDVRLLRIAKQKPSARSAS